MVRLIGIDADTDRIRVAAEVYPVDTAEGSEPQWRFYDFPTLAAAQHFADQALLALEYLGCVVVEGAAGAASAPDEVRTPTAA